MDIADVVILGAIIMLVRAASRSKPNPGSRGTEKHPDSCNDDSNNITYVFARTPANSDPYSRMMNRVVFDDDD